MARRGEVWLGPLLSAGLLLLSSSADAGKREPWDVSVNTTTRVATGSMGSARAGAGDQYIGCTIGVTGTDEAVTGNVVYHTACQAKSAAGTEVSCTFPDIPVSNTTTPTPPLLLLSRDAKISFKWNTTNGTNVCTSVQTWVYASLRPKTF